MSTVPHVNTQDFTAEVKQASVPVLVDFYAQWCGPCKMMSPEIDKLANKMDGKMKVVKLDTDESPEIATEFGIMGVPTLIIFKDGKAIDRKVGYVNEKDLASFVGRHVG